MRFFLFLTLFYCSFSFAELRVAVASNFVLPMKELTDAWSVESGSKVTISSGSSGKLFAQIVHGAPFDVFFSADVQKPENLEEQALTLADSRFTYALGKLVLVSLSAELRREHDFVSVLKKARGVSLANPRHAPYGVAGDHILKKLERQKPFKRVMGENVAQAFHFVITGSVDAGLVSYSQVISESPTGINTWKIPAEWYPPIEQQAVVLKNGRFQAEAIAFMKFIKSAKGQSIIRNFGYQTADSSVLAD